MSAYQPFSRHIWVALALASSACSSIPINQAKLSYAKTALHGAETLGADKDPKAKQSLELARQAIAQAEKLAKEGEGEKANGLLERAGMDADMASQLMRTQGELVKAQEAAEKLKTAEAATQAPQ